MSHFFKPAPGPNWEDLDEDDLKMFAPDEEKSADCDGDDNADDSATPAVENVQAVVYNAADEYYDDTPVSLNAANLKYLNEVWHTCHALPAYAEFSFDKYCYQPYVRVQYNSNWLNFKECMGVDVRKPMLMKFSPLRLSLTREYDDEGGFVIREAGTLVDGPLFPHAEFKPSPDDSETEEEAEEPQMQHQSTPCVPGSREDKEPQTPPRSPPCVPGFRDDDELEEYNSETEDAADPLPSCDEGTQVDGPIIRFYSYFDSGVIVDVERNDNDEAEEYASSTADESTDSSAEDSYGEELSKLESPVTSVSSAFSDSSEDGTYESDITSTSEIEEDNVCVTLDITPTGIREGVVSTEETGASIQPITTAIEGSHITSKCLDIASSTETTDNTSTLATDPESVPEGLVFNDDTKGVTITSSPTEEASVATSSSMEALLTPESGDDNQTEQLTEKADVVLEDSVSTIEIASPVSVPFEDDILISIHLSTAEVKCTDYTPPGHHTEDIATGYVDSSTTLIEDAGVSPDFVFSQPPSTTPLVWDVVCTAGFALSSVPWLRIGVATAGLMVDVAATLLRR